MPLEIKELHIRVAVTSGAGSAGGGTGAATAAPAAGYDKECIIAECVEQVLQILENKMER
ncbi:hypothetical protein GMSM_18010 [Geomonas sp. Red276]